MEREPERTYDIWHHMAYGVIGTPWYPISSRHLSLLRNGRSRYPRLYLGYYLDMFEKML
jgi:hypothetical protein